MASMAETLAGIKTKFKKENPDIIFDPKRKIDFISTGNFVFDLVSGGGFPRRRVSEVFGMEHSGKTAITLQAARQVVSEGGVVIFMDHEQAWNEEHARKTYGLENDGVHFVVFQPQTLEEADAMVQDFFTKLDKIDLLIFDSVDAMRPEAFINGKLEDGDARVGAHAKGMARILSKIVRLSRDKNCATVFINQMRSNINTGKEQNIGTAAGFNVQESYTTTGGHALRFYASLRCKMEYGGKIEAERPNPIEGGVQTIRIGNQVKIINVKNKVSTPFLQSRSHFYFPMAGQRGGWNTEKDILELLRKRARVRQASTKFTYFGFAPEFKEWISGGKSKDASEQLFMGSPQLIDDARKLLKSLMDLGEGDAALADLAVPGVDFSAADSQELSVEELTAAGVGIDLNTGMTGEITL